MPTIVQTQYKLPGFVVSNGVVTGNPWTYPDNILYVDDNLALSDVNQGSSSDMIIGGFNPNLDADAVVVGIEMKLIAKMGSTTIPATTLTIYAVDNTSGENVYYPYTTPVSLTLDLDTYILGTPTYLFGQGSLTVDQINNLKLQMVANGDISVDSLLLNVYYYLPDSPVPPTPPDAGCEDCNSPIQVPEMFLQLPFNIGDTEFFLTPGSMQYADGTPVQPGDVGACGGTIDFVFDQGQLKTISNNNFEENATLDLSTGYWEVLASGVVKVVLGSINDRALLPHTPYTHDTNLQSDHDANTKVIISNNGKFYSRFVRECFFLEGNPTINGDWTFSAFSPTIPTEASSEVNRAASIGYVNNIAIAGAPDASTTVKGITRLSTSSDTALGNVTITIASPAVVTLLNHGLTEDDSVVFATTGALPTGLVAGTTYYVISAGLTSSEFEVSATIGGTAINTSGSQSGVQSVTRTTPIALGFNDLASLTNRGIVEIATAAEIDAGTATGATGASLAVRPDQLALSIYATRLPTADQKAALAGTSGTPSATNKYVTENDTSNSAYIKANTLSFTASTKTIADSGSGFVTANFRAGDSIVVSGTVSNNGTFTIVSVAAGAIVVVEALVNESAGTIFTIVTDITNKLIRNNGATRFLPFFSPYAASGAGTDTYAITVPGITSYNNGEEYEFKADVGNTGAATLNINGLGAISLVTGLSTALVTGDILANQIVKAIYNSTGPVFQVVNPASMVVLAPSYFNTSFTKDISSTTTTTIPHGLGRAPKQVSISAIFSSGTNSHALSSFGTWDASGQSCSFQWWDTNGNPQGVNVDVTVAVWVSYASSSGSGLSKAMKGTVTVDATNITITWANVGAGNDSVTAAFTVRASA